MRNRASPWLAAGVGFLLFGTATWPLPRLLGLDGSRAWLLRGGLLFFAMAVAVLILLFLLKRMRQAPVSSATEDIDNALAAAEARLAASGSEARLGRLPVAFVVGPVGSTKTSIVTHGAPNPELLSGEVMRGDTITPTDPLNVWYAEGAVFVEAGGRLLDDDERWSHFARRLRPTRFAAAIGRGRQAPRFAILCIGCDEFNRPGAAQNLAAMARTVRARLGELSQQLGVRLPVYVLFTRADRLPHFADYVRNLSNDEAHQVLGTTLPLLTETGGTWAERESRRLNEAFGRLVHAISLRRLYVLPREAQDDIRSGAYEFPRELRKVVDPAVQLLLDIFRPSQLGVSPFLRGFYFTGVRPVVLRDVADAGPGMQGPAAVDAGATSVFNAAALRQASQAGPLPGGGRKVPQWLFLRRLFQEVLLRDEAAAQITGSGRRVDLLRRGLIASAAAACVVLSLGFTFSFAGNRSLIRTATAAVEQSRDVGTIPGSATEEELERLDALRASAAELSDFERNGRPVRLGWGLYRGGAVHPLVRRAYFDRFEAAMWNTTRERLTSYLRNGLPEEPTPDSDFGQAQDALAAYLLTTRRNDMSSPELLTGTLMRFWAPREPGDTLAARAERQFAFFASELPLGNPYATEVDDALVQRTQRFLLAFGPEAYYRALVYEANRATQPARFAGSGAVVRNDYVVPGAFTRTGWWNVQANLDSVENLFVRYQWIYGTATPRNKPNRDELARMYEADYVRHWQEYLRSASIARFESTADAATKLRVLADASSPLVAMLALAARETAMEDTVTLVGRAFQPLRATVPVSDPRGPAANLAGYSNQLNSLHSQLNLLAGGPPGAAEQVWPQASAAANAVNMEVGTLAATYLATEEAAATSREVQRLLRAPVEAGLTLVRGLPAEGVNNAAESFCRQFRALESQYPFSRNGRDADVRAVTEFFRKTDGALWAFYNSTLSNLLTPQGRATDANVRSDFQRFFRRAVDFSEALYRDGGSPLVVFDFLPTQYPEGATEIILELNRTTNSFTRARNTTLEVPWYPERGQSASLVVRFGAESVEVAKGAGNWAVFRMFQNTTWQDENGRWLVTWSIPGRQALKAYVDFVDRERPVLRESFFNDLRCRSRVLN
jgi:type VI secretion system protein ImpL